MAKIYSNLNIVGLHINGPFTYNNNPEDGYLLVSNSEGLISFATPSFYGATGATGTNGTSGTSGVNGTSGTSGIDGTSGTSGIDGTSGTSGTSGIDGTSGTSGVDGTSGTSGIDGTSGTSGTSGIDGTSGTSGVDGTSGTSGIDGTSGTSGIDGTSGTSGVDGTSGTSGVNGTSGTSGVNGTSGISGRAKDVRILGTNGVSYNWLGFTNGVISVGSLTTLNPPIDISLLVDSPTSNLNIRMYLSFSASSVSAGSVLLGQMTLGPSTYRVGKFTRTLFAKPFYSYDGSGEASAYTVNTISYIYSTDISDAQTGATGGSASNGVVTNTNYYYSGDEPNYYPQYLVIDIPNNAFAYNLNIQHGL